MTDALPAHVYLMMLCPPEHKWFISRHDWRIDDKAHITGQIFFQMTEKKA